jgi:pyruvate/2-oxoglutarate dehydrogenase complex dihydrolipoamide acyltransferase (E2) component
MDVLMPKLGLTMNEGTVSAWLVEDGVEVEAGDPICEIETDKVTEEIVADVAGVLRHAVARDSVVAAGGVIGRIE